MVRTLQEQLSSDDVTSRFVQEKRRARLELPEIWAGGRTTYRATPRPHDWLYREDGKLSAAPDPWTLKLQGGHAQE